MAKKSNDVEVIYNAAVTKESGAERFAYLNAVCGDDNVLRARVETLLKAHEQVGDYLEAPPVGPNATLDDSPLIDAPGTKIGRYELLELIGEGGMGLVYMAQQKKPVKRRVALKIIKPGMDSKQIIARFEAERQTLAVLDHPNIAHVFDAGTTKTGRPYFIMEYVKGMSITRYCDEKKLNIEQRLRLFEQVCEGIHHAHQKGIIHRDLKPTNILVSVHGDRAVPKIIDFGIAKAVTQPLTEKTFVTFQGQLLGTPEYMSPEQVDLATQDIDTRSDIYSLGVVLYELLAGVLPFDRESLAGLGFAEIQRTIREQEPASPSIRLTSLGEKAKTIAASRDTHVVALARRLHRELEWIPLKAMRKDRCRRYRSASELADDVRNYLNGLPLIAGPETSVYRVKKFVHKHAGSVATVALVSATIVLGLIVSSVMYFRAETMRIDAEQAREKEAIARTEVEQALLRAEEAEKLAENRAEEFRRSLYRSNIASANIAYRDSDIGRVHRLLRECPDDLRAWEWYHLNHVSDQSIMTLTHHDGHLFDIASSPNDVTILSPGMDGTIKLWDAASHRELMTLRGHDSLVTSARFSPDGKRIVSGGVDRTIRVWDTATGKELMMIQDTAVVLCATFSPDGKRLLSSGRLKAIQMWEVSSGTKLMTLSGHKDWVYSVAFSPNANRIVSAGRDKTVGVWDATTGQQLMLLTGHQGRVGRVVVSPDGKHVVSASEDKTLKVWNLETGIELMTLRGHKEMVGSVSFSPDGTRIVSGGDAIRVWDAASGTELTTLWGHQKRISGVGFVAHGERIVSSSLDGTIKIWEPEGTRPAPLILEGRYNSMAFHPDSEQIVTVGKDKAIRIWDVDTTSELMKIDEAGGSVSFSPDGKRVIAADGNDIKVWDASSGKKLMTLSGHEDAIWSVSYNPDGTRILSGGKDKTIRIWNATTGAEVMTLRGHGDWSIDPNFSPISSVAFSPNGKLIASGSYDETVKIWNAKTGTEARTLKHSSIINDIAFSPDSRQIVSASGVRAQVWDVATGSESLTLGRHDGEVISVAFSPDGKRIVSGSKDETVKIWDAANGLEMMVLRTGGRVWELCFSPDGRTIATNSFKGTVGRGREGTIALWESAMPSTEYMPPRTDAATR